jgi:anti-anti-sigma factor
MTEQWRASSIRGFRVGFREEADVLIVECHGRLTYGNTKTLTNEVKVRIPERKRLVLDLKDVPQMDSSGLGAVMALYVSARARGCKLELVNAGEPIRALFSVTNLLSLFEAAGRHHGKTI